MATTVLTKTPISLLLAPQSDVHHPDVPVWADRCRGCSTTGNNGHPWCVECSWDETL